MYEEVLQTKIKAPPVHSRIIPRPRLIERLKSSRNRKLILVSAPAGFGKTTLLNEWARSTNDQICWFSIDNEDDDLKTFWIHFVSSIIIFNADIGKTAMEMLRSPQRLPIRAILTTLINEIFTKGKDITIILDDYHLIRDNSVHKSIEFLIERMPSQCHLVISTRTQVPFPIGRMRIEGQLVEMNMEDLRFNQTEIGKFAEQILARKLDEESVEALHAHSEGWPAGLQIAALAAERNSDILKPVVSEIQTHILDYFVDEIFSFQPERIQKFLTETSILRRLNASLCDAVTRRQDSGSILEHLCVTNMFILPLDQRGFWYRYHHMFAELLRTRLAKLDSKYIRDLHSRAARWFKENKLRNEAIHHAIAAEDWNFAAELVIRYGTIAILRGDSATALRWIRGLPGSTISGNPLLCLSYAWALFLTHLGRFSSMPFHSIENLLNDAEKFYPELLRTEGPDGKTFAALTAHIDALRVHLAYSRNEPREKVIELGIKTLRKFPENDVFIRTNIHFTLALNYLDTGDLESCSRSLEAARSAALIGGYCTHVILADSFRAFLSKLRGRLLESELIYTSGMESVKQSLVSTNKMSEDILGYYDIHKAGILFEKNHMEEASQLIDKAIGSAHLMAEATALQFGYQLMFFIRLFGGAGEEAVLYPLKKIENMGVHNPKARSLSVVLRIRYLVTRLDRKADNLQLAFGLAEQYGIRLGVFAEIEKQKYPVPFIRNLNLFEQLTLIRLHLADAFLKKGKKRLSAIEKVVDHLRKLLERIRFEGFGLLEIEALILLALALDAHNEKNEDEAVEAFKTAVKKAEPEGFLRIFANEGERLSGLLNKCIDTGFSVEFGERILMIIRSEANGSSYLAAGRISLAESSKLSRQERRILKLISHGMSNHEIAEKLCIALTTVKTHNYRIFRKLGVSRRMDAAEKAKKLVL